MKINWDKIPKTPEEIVVAEYIKDRTRIIERLIEVYTQENFLSISFTPTSFKGNFYTYELKYHQHDRRYLINVWKRVRVGDALPILYGYLQDY